MKDGPLPLDTGFVNRIRWRRGCDMPHSFSRLYVHLVWGTKDRAPVLAPEFEGAVHACIVAACRSMGAQTLAIGGTADHVHVLVELPATLSVADLAKQVKGSSSHLVNHELDGTAQFAWQRGYAAFSVSAGELDAVRDYIHNQRSHHAAGTISTAHEPPTKEA